jgi:hypothetical protein
MKVTILLDLSYQTSRLMDIPQALFCIADNTKYKKRRGFEMFANIMKRIFISALFLAAMVLVLPANAQLDKILGGLGNRGTPSDSKTASGLKEALQVGTDRAVDLTGTADGFFRNEAIKILLPEKLRSVEKGLRVAGMGAKIDEFELSMNRAAEKAAPAARAIFKSALMKMTFNDARKILTGGGTSATEYFKANTSDKLTAAFRPTVESAMADTGVVMQYKQLMGGGFSLPFGHSQTFDITDFVVGKSLDGLFYMVGQEEKNIRTNPAAQITPLLKEVFGKR